MQINTVNGIVTGTIDSQQLSASISGNVYTTGSGGNGSVTYAAVPSAYNPYTHLLATKTNHSANGLQEISGGLNLFSLTGGNYTVNKKVTYNGYSSNYLNYSATVNTSSTNFTVTSSVSGILSGLPAIDSVVSYEGTWSVVNGFNIIDVGQVVLHISGTTSQLIANYLGSYTSSKYMNDMTELYSISFPTQSWDGTTSIISFNGTVTCNSAPAPEA